MPQSSSSDPHKKSTTDRSLALTATRTGLAVLSRVAPGAASRAAAALFCTPRRHRRPERELEVLARAEPLTLRMGHGQLAAWRWGTGPTVLLAHGWEGRGSQLQAFVDPLLARGFSVLAWDGPGHGDSPGRRSSVVELADGVFAAARTVDDLAGVVAHSAGAVATALAVSEGLVLPRAAFVAPPSDIGNYLRRFRELLPLPPRVERRMVDLMQERFQVLLEDLDVRRLKVPDDVPLLVVHDRDDKEVSWEQGRTVAERWPGAQLVLTEGLGHRRLLRDPATVRGIVGWLADDAADDDTLPDRDVAASAG